MSLPHSFFFHLCEASGISLSRQFLGSVSCLTCIVNAGRSQGILDIGKCSRIVLIVTDVSIVQSGQRQALANCVGKVQEFVTVTVSILL